jgi:hypothetical protein
MRRPIVPDPISARIDLIGLDRALRLRLMATLIADACRRYDEFRGARVGPDGRFFEYATFLAAGNLLHVFNFWLDDTTSPAHVIIDDFAHQARPLPS